MQRLHVVFGVVSLALFGGNQRGANAHCLMGESNLGNAQWVFDIGGNEDIPVYLVAPNATVLGQNSTLVGRAVGRAVEAVNRFSYSGARLSYEGIVANLPGAQDYGIFIDADSSCMLCGGAVACTDPPLRKVGDPDYVQNIKIHFSYNPGTCPSFNWQFYPDFAGSDDIQAVATHELLHALGLAHSGNNGNCPNKPSDVGSDGIMATFGSQYPDQRYLSRDDAEGLIALYNRKFGELDYHYGTDGITWRNGSLLNDIWSHSVPGGASTSLEGETQLWFSYHVLLGSWVVKLRALLGNSAGIAVNAGADVWDPPSTATGNGVLVMATLEGETRQNRSKDLVWYRSANAGSTWTSVPGERDGGFAIHTKRDGVSVAYDPDSHRFAAAYIGDNNLANSSNLACADDPFYSCDQVRVVTIVSNLTDQNHANLVSSSLPIRTAAPPTLVCGPSSVGTGNCIIAWTSVTSNACITWRHADIDASGEFVLVASSTSGCYHGFSPAFMTYDKSTATKAFRLAFTQEGPGQNGAIFTLRKDGAANTSWTDIQTIAVSPWRQLGGYGTLESIGDQLTRVLYLREGD